MLIMKDEEGNNHGLFKVLYLSGRTVETEECLPRLQVSGSRIKPIVFYIRITHANHSTVIFENLQGSMKLSSLL
jgi:hypothetical protein